LKHFDSSAGELTARLTELRQAIDDIDDQLLRLFNQRARIAQEVGKVKNRFDTESYIPTREKEILKRVRARNPGPLPSEAVEAVFREVISACRALETNLAIAYLGPEATFHHTAAQSHFGRSARYIPMDTIRAVFQEVECRRVHYGIVAIENSIEGSVTQTIDFLAHSNIRVTGEIFLPITHNLISFAELHDIDKVYSHPQALAQCRNWLETNLPQARLIDAPSTTEGVRFCLQDRKAAAIGSALASEMLDVPIQVHGIEDYAGNTTRFFIIGLNTVPPTGDDKTSMVVFLRDQVGALFSMLEPFKNRGINLTNIQSRPTKQEAWQYMFFLECQGHYEDENVRQALEDIKSSSLYVKILGSYPFSRMTAPEIKSPSGS